MQMCILIIFFFGLSSANGQPINYRDDSIKGDLAYKDKRYYDALSKYMNIAKQSDYATLQVGKLIYNEKVYIKDQQQFLDVFERLSKKNNSEATVYLGFLYYRGRGVKQNFDLALKCFRKAEKDSNAYAMTMLGIMHYFGKGLPQDYKASKSYFEKALKMGDKLATVWLSTIYEKGYNTNVNVNKAISLLEEGCVYDDSYSCSALATRYFQGKNVIKKDTAIAVVLYKKSLQENENNAYAKFYLSLIYRDKQGRFFNEILSKKMNEDAMNNASSFELFNIAIYYLDTIKDTNMALALFKKAKDKGETLATFYIALIYEEGLSGKSKNLDTAKILYRKLVDLGMPGLGYYHLGRLNYSNHSTWDSAKYFFEQSIEFGETNAMVALGLIYSSLNCTCYNISKAKALLKQAADVGNEWGKMEYDKITKQDP